MKTTYSNVRLQDSLWKATWAGLDSRRERRRRPEALMHADKPLWAEGSDYRRRNGSSDSEQEPR